MLQRGLNGTWCDIMPKQASLNDFMISMPGTPTPQTRPETLTPSTPREKLKPVYDAPLWENFCAAINELVDCLATSKPEREKQPTKPVAEEEVAVEVDNKYYGKCPKCGTSFNYHKHDVGRLVRCRSCNLPMRLKWAPEAEGD